MLSFFPISGGTISGLPAGADFEAAAALICQSDTISIHASLGNSPGLMQLFENNVPAESVCGSGCGEGAYNYGDLLRLRVVITTLDKILTDPQTVTLFIKRPDGTVETHTTDIIRNNVGNYQCDYFIPAGGPYFYRWDAEGGVDVVEEGAFTANFSSALS